MQLIGMLDSPFVRRVAISALALGVPFTHRSVSVFRGFDEFKQINSVVKAPTVVAADGTVLMDSGLILEYVEALARPKSLMPQGFGELLRALRVVGLSLAACEKTVQIVYERGLRLPEKHHQPWIDRVSGQLRAAYSELDAEIQASAVASTSVMTLGQGGISAAVAWYFTQQMLPEVIAAATCPNLVGLSRVAELLPEFRAAPYGERVVGGGD